MDEEGPKAPSVLYNGLYNERMAGEQGPGSQTTLLAGRSGRLRKLESSATCVGLWGM